MLVALILVVVGFAAGTLGSLIGLGGGIIVVPALINLGMYSSLFSGVTAQIAAGTSLMITIVTAFSSTITYYKHKTIDFKSAWLLFIGTAPAGIAGAYVNKFLDLDDFQLYFGLFLLILAVILYLRRNAKPKHQNSHKGFIRNFKTPDGNEYTYSFNPYLAVLVSFVAGFVSGLFGIGGGSLMVPAMIMLYHFPPHIAVGTSMFIILTTSILSVGTHIALGNVNWLYALCLAPGAWFGSKFGSYLNTRLKGQTVVLVLRLALVILGLRLIWEGLS